MLALTTTHHYTSGAGSMAEYGPFVQGFVYWPIVWGFAFTGQDEAITNHGPLLPVRAGMDGKGEANLLQGTTRNMAELCFFKSWPNSLCCRDCWWANISIIAGLVAGARAMAGELNMPTNLMAWEYGCLKEI